MSVNGEPVLSEVPNTNLKFVVNTQWPLFFDSGNSTYYLAVGQQWLASNSLEGQWSATKKLPPDMSKVPQDKQWSALKKFIPPSAKSAGVTPAVFYSDKPAEVILFDGQPVYAQIPDTQLQYATNTNSVVFVYTPTQQFYYLTAGRWFRTTDLQQGPWTYATPDLPPDFAKIPLEQSCFSNTCFSSWDRGSKGCGFAGAGSDNDDGQLRRKQRPRLRSSMPVIQSLSRSREHRWSMPRTLPIK